MQTPKIAFVHEWLTCMGGSEKVLEAALALYPDAPVFTLVHDPESTRSGGFSGHKIIPSFINRLPFARRKWRTYLPLMPLAVEQFDLAGYDVVISSNHAVAKGALTRADQMHISYVHSPVRYAWDLQNQYLAEANLQRGLRSMLARSILHYIRLWDALAANRVDYFLANSHYIARRVRKAYRREAAVIYPPVDVERFNPARKREGFYLAFSRFVPYKRMDLIAETFTALRLPLKIIGDGPDWKKVARVAGPNVELLGKLPDSGVKEHLETCKALVFAADEDFGIVPVEAQAAGAPVIAFGRGGVCETVIAGKTGLFFEAQTAQSLAATVREFQACPAFDSGAIGAHAAHFSRARFQVELRDFVARKWLEFSAESRTGKQADVPPPVLLNSQ